MKITFAFLAGLICIQLYACGNNNKIEQTNNTNTSNTDTAKMKITTGTAVFTASLNNNATATAFKERLPITINMTELNGNEKYFDLPNTLPANASKPVTIQNRDLMLYGSNTLVLLYKTFSTPYSYTQIGHIENASDLIAELGTGNVTVKFELK